MKWSQARGARRCAFWCEIPRRTFAWFGRWRQGRQFVLCQGCGRDRYEMVPPVLAADMTRDGKREALGRDA